jgi:hypothetical protein
MSWFERHLNWSLVFGLIVVPFVINLTVDLVTNIPVVRSLIGSSALVVYGILAMVFALFGLVVTWWYLSQKERSRWYLLLLVVPWVLSLIGFLLTGGMIGSLLSLMLTGELPPGAIFGFIILVLGGVASIVGFVWLLRLNNKAIGYGGDFAAESAGGEWPETMAPAVPDDRQLKELDYTPDKQVMDMVDGQEPKDIRAATEISNMDNVGSTGTGGEEPPAEAEIQAGEEVKAESPAEEKVEEKTEEKVVVKAVSQEILKMPILLDDAGAAIHCYYHPGADAVNLCSRCKQYVCIECNYVTGTHPICRNCWEKRIEHPIAPPPVKKPERTVEDKPKQSEEKKPSQPETQEAAKLAEPVEQQELTTKPEKQKIVKPDKSSKLEAERNEWLTQFMSLYEQASATVSVVIRKSADGMPASPLDLMEGLKLRPMLDRAKKLSKPRDKDLRDIKDDFEKVLSSCIKIADTAADFVSGGGQALLGGPDFKRIVDGIETANGLMEKLSQRLSAFPKPHEPHE